MKVITLSLIAEIVTLSYSLLELKEGAMTIVSPTNHPDALSIVIEVSPGCAEEVSLV